MYGLAVGVSLLAQAEPAWLAEVQKQITEGNARMVKQVLPNGLSLSGEGLIKAM